MAYGFQRICPHSGSQVIIPTLIIILGSVLIGFILQTVARLGGLFDTKAAQADSLRSAMAEAEFIDA